MLYRIIIIPLLLFLLTTDPALSETGFPAESNRKVDNRTVFTLTAGQNDSLARMKIYGFNNVYGNSGEDDYIFFYKNLEKTAKQRTITRWLYEMLVKDPVVAEPMVPTVPLRSESLYADSEGKTINNIEFRTIGPWAAGIDNPYFNPDGMKRLGSFLHTNTNEIIIRNNLLFGPDDKLDPFILAHNELLLRRLPYIEDARIYVYDDAFDPEMVNVVVVTKDRWSWGFDMDMSDVDRGKVEIYDKNILGMGQELELALKFDAANEEPVGFKTGLNLGNIGRTFLSSGTYYSRAFGNREFNIRAGRYFLFPSMKYAGGIEFTSSRLIEDYIFPDRLFIDQKVNFNEYDYWLGRSFQLQGGEVFNRRNIYLTSRFNRNIFYERPDIDENIRYDFHNRDIFLMSLTYTRLGHLKNNYIYGFGPAEDLPLGSRLEAITGYEESEFFSRWYAGFNLSLSNHFEGVAYLQNKISFGGFINGNSFDQGVLKVETSGFSNLFDLNSYYMRQFFTINFTRGYSRLDDEFLTISNRQGIRGLRSDALRGSRKLTMQTETMFYSKSNWYGFKYALFTIADLGWVGAGQSDIMDEGFYSGFGLGIRLRNEHLVFPTLQFRISWFPKLPEQASARWFYISSERSRFFDEFRIRAPEVVPYR